MAQSVKAVILIQTPLMGPRYIGMNASLQEKLGAEGLIRVVRGPISTDLYVELLSLERDCGKEIRISPNVAEQLGVIHREEVMVRYERDSRQLYIRACGAK